MKSPEFSMKAFQLLIAYVPWLVPQITAAATLHVVCSSAHSALLNQTSSIFLLSKEVIGQSSGISECKEGALKN